MKKLAPILLILLLLLIPLSSALAQSQDEEFNLSLSRDWGYGGFAGDIQGTFSMKISGPDSLVSVDFYIDDQLIGTDNEAPFRLQFNTDSYPPGTRTMHAVGHTTDGRELTSTEITRTFLSADEAGGLVTKILVPFLVVVLAFSVIGVVGPLLFRRNSKSFKLGEYSSLAGGTVCRRCGLPFSRHTLGPNLVFGKLERCPHCGRIAIVGRASPDELEKAEARYRQEREEGVFKPEETEEERLRRQLDQSRFED